MWSGPRNISTALMRSFENRTDTKVYDEPFYSYYLKNTNLDHPMKEEIDLVLNHLANVYYKTNLPLNKHFRHQKCLFRGRFVLYYRATQIPPNLGFTIRGIKAFLRGLTRLKK